jgi:hypothetical protein
MFKNFNSNIKAKELKDFSIFGFDLKGKILQDKNKEFVQDDKMYIKKISIYLEDFSISATFSGNVFDKNSNASAYTLYTS